MALSKDSQKINQILKSTGCMTISQVCAIMPEKSEKAIRFILSQLYHQNYINFIDHNYLVPYRCQTISREAILGMWAMLDTSPCAEYAINVEQEINTLGPSEFPSMFMYVHKNKLVDVVYIHRDNTSSLLYLEKSIRNRLAEDALNDYSLLIIIEDEALIEQIANVNLSVPNTIALVRLNGDLCQRPSIDYYS